ncbi:MAG: hypothetical protein WC752_01355 [Patescibacteria group bacterium]|jgi:hypothetical protein
MPERGENHPPNDAVRALNFFDRFIRTNLASYDPAKRLDFIDKVQKALQEAMPDVYERIPASSSCAMTADALNRILREEDPKSKIVSQLMIEIPGIIHSYHPSLNLENSDELDKLRTRLGRVLDEIYMSNRSLATNLLNGYSDENIIEEAIDKYRAKNH